MARALAERKLDDVRGKITGLMPMESVLDNLVEPCRCSEDPQQCTIIHSLHGHYDLKELRRCHGNWIDDYTTPEPGRFHDGLKAGQNAQAGFILELMLRSLIERKGYDEADFCQRLDNDLFPLLDGSPR